MIYDTFPFFNELDLLECRLTELYDLVDVFVAVEADVDHQGNPKLYVLSENLDRFAPFADKLRVIRATGLPTVEDAPNAWSREQAQREFVKEGLVYAGPDDTVYHGDVDEIPSRLVVRNLRPRGFWSVMQRGLFWALDWQYPDLWEGTVAARVRDIDSFAVMRNSRRLNRLSVNGGWHFSWMGGAEAHVQKAHAFCHPEIIPVLDDALADGHRFLVEGVHTDGKKLIPVEVDDTYPRWVREGNAPDSWYRPR